MANTSGGDIIYGIKEDKDNFPVELCGIALDSPDEEKRGLLDLIFHGVEPPIPGVDPQEIPLPQGNYALVIRIPQSFRSPHRVKFNKHYQFYIRESNRSRPMEIDELRVAFNLSETLADRIRHFREERTAKVIVGETSLVMPEYGKILFHLVPISSFGRPSHLDTHMLEVIAEEMRKQFIQEYPFGRFNFDGVLYYDRDQEPTTSSFQLFENGIIEAINSNCFSDPEDRKIIYSEYHEAWIHSRLKHGLGLLESLNIMPPILLFLNMLGVKGYSMAIDELRWRVRPRPIEKDHLFAREQLIESYDIDLLDVLRPCFDSFWRACGINKSLNFDNEGNWIGRYERLE